MLSASSPPWQHSLSCFLTLCNLVDALMGCGLGVYAAYLGVNKYAPLWMVKSIGAVAVLLMVEATMSTCGVQHQSNICLSCATFVAVPLMLGETALCIALYKAAPSVLHYLRANQADLKLSNSDISLLQRYADLCFGSSNGYVVDCFFCCSKHMISVYVFAGLAVMEVIRIFASGQLRGENLLDLVS